MSTGCGKTLEARRQAAAEALGKAAAADALPGDPAECSKDEPHAPIAAGMEARSIIVRERSATSLANASKRRCHQWYLDLRREREKV